MFDAGRFIVAIAFLSLLFVIFIGMGKTVLGIVQGRPPAVARQTEYRDGFFTSFPIVATFVLVLLMGIYIPSPLRTLLNDASRFLEVRP